MTISTRTYQNIMVSGDGVPVEGKVYAALYPGHLVEWYNDSTVEKLRKHATEGGTGAPFIVAIEDEEQGKTIDDVYAVDNNMKARALQGGEEVYLRLKDGESVVYGDKVESAGDGTVQKHTAVLGDSSAPVTIYFNSIVGTVRQIIDRTDSSGGDTSAFVLVQAA